MNEQHEQAARALELGKQAFDQGIYDKSVRLLEKSLRMRKTAEAEALLTCAQKSLARQQAKAATTASNGGNSSSSEQPAPTTSQRAYTKEQEEGCKRILLCKTHYEVLSIEKGTASADEIKKAYRKLALRYHPDKCGAPKAEEAFKKLSKAFEVLSDEDSRAHYDRYGDADPNAVGGGGGMRHRGGGGGGFYQHPFAAGGQEMDMDDILRMFMQGGGGGFGGGRAFHFAAGGGGRHQHRHARAAGDGPPQAISLQQILFFLLSLFFMFSSFGGGGTSSGAQQRGAATPYQTNLYSLFPVAHFPVERKTTMNGVVRDIPYFVDAKFANTIGKSPRDLYYVETAVESSTYSMLKERCIEEKKRTRNANVESCARQREFELRKSKN